MKIFPVLHTNRLHLRQPLKADIDFIFMQRSSPIVNKFIKRELAKSREDAVAHFEKICTNFKNDVAIAWSICLRDPEKIVGSICLWNYSSDGQTAEVGYDLHPDFHNKGIMSEAIKPVVSHGLSSMGFNTIEAFTDRRNEASKRMLLKNRFVHEPARSDEGNPDNWIFVLKK